MRKLYQELAQLVDARLRCLRDGDKAEWATKHEDTIEYLVKQFMPSGSGFDSGTKIDLDKSTSEKLVFTTAYHHMHESGMYNGWTEHTVTVTSSLAFNFTMRISGRNRDDIKDYMRETFDAALNEDCEFALLQRLYTVHTRAGWSPDGSRIDKWVLSVRHNTGSWHRIEREYIADAQAEMVKYITLHSESIARLP